MCVGGAYRGPIGAPTGPYRGPYRSPEALAATQGGPDAFGLGPIGIYRACVDFGASVSVQTWRC